MFEIVIFLLLAAIVNSIGDALKFSGATTDGKYDFLWHIIKYFVQIPLWMFSGYYLGIYVVENHLWDFWHPKNFHLQLIGIVAVATLLWQLFYFVIKTKLSETYETLVKNSTDLRWNIPYIISNIIRH